MYLTIGVVVRKLVVLVAAAFCATAETSVKTSTTSAPNDVSVKVLSDGRWLMTNYSLYWLIQLAYNIPYQYQRVYGGDDWIRNDRFDIELQLSQEAFEPGFPRWRRNAIREAVLQELLRDRFHLKARRESKESPVYVVVQGPSGVKLEQAGMLEKDCLPDRRNGCHTFDGGIGRGLRSDAATIEDAVGFISSWMDRQVVDKTGLTGLYKFNMPGWAPMSGPIHREGLDDPKRPSIFAIFGMMGLRLESGSEKLDTITIESAERTAAK